MSKGDVESFKVSWRSRPETKRYHFRAGPPQHQVEFAFQNHWRVFQSLLDDVRNGIVLEIGAGRGSIAAFFANAGYEVHLLDTSSTALLSGRDNFQRDGLHGHYVVGDALRLPYASNSLDIVVSIGLMEHFEALEAPCAEQVRVLRPGGMLLNYVVPERALSVQTLALPINAALKAIYSLSLLARRQRLTNPVPKTQLYRNRFGSKEYLRVYRQLGVHDCGAYGTFPLPLVSHSPRFPFSPMTPAAEQLLLTFWRGSLRVYGWIARHDPWICNEYWGLAFVAWARK